MAETRTVKRGDQLVRQKRCAVGKEWRDEVDFHFRTPKHETRSSRCRFHAAEAQRQLRLRKKNLLPRKPGGRFGIDPELETTGGKASKAKAGVRRAG
jgi:hypothetical protein